MDRLVEAVEAATSRLAVEREGFWWQKLAETGRPSNDSAHRFKASSKAFGFNAINTLRMPPIFGGFAPESKSMHQPDVLVPHPLCNGGVTLRAHIMAQQANAGIAPQGMLSAMPAARFGNSRKKGKKLPAG